MIKNVAISKHAIRWITTLIEICAHKIPIMYNIKTAISAHKRECVPRSTLRKRTGHYNNIIRTILTNMYYYITHNDKILWLFH